MTSDDYPLTRIQVEAAAASVGPLRPWMKRLAEWHATQPGRVKQRDVLAMAQMLANVKLPRPVVLEVLKRDDWLEYRETMALDDLARIRKKQEGRVEEYMDTHHWALQMAKKGGDYKTAASIAEPVLDRLWPKREEKGAGAQTIIVTMPQGQTTARIIDQEPIPIEIVTSDQSTGQ